MKGFARGLATVTLTILLVSAPQAAEKPKPATSSLSAQAEAMTIWQARRIVAAGNLVLSNPTAPVDRGFRFTIDNFEFDGYGAKGKPEHFIVDLKTIEAVSIKCTHYVFNPQVTMWCVLKNEAGKSLNKKGTGGVWFFNFERWDENPSGDSTCTAPCVAAAESFAAALNRLRAFANDSESPLRTFPQQAAAWRALPAKPPLPDEVRAQRLLAEEAIQQKNAAEALNRYDTGLQIYPTWPQGRFNAALIAAELGFYVEAVEHMQAYLELVPDAQDAPSARDQIVAWQYRIKHPVQAAKP